MKNIAEIIKLVGFLAVITFNVRCENNEFPDEEGLEDTLGYLCPFSENPRYWQYKGEPVLLLGATDDDNLFQWPAAGEHLAELAAVGGNYVRNTMSCRDSSNLWPYQKLENGVYDLDLWNEEFWELFDNFLKLAWEKNIIVQIEIWDKFDYEGEVWQRNPVNPKNNMNYTYAESSLKENVSSKDQVFFHSFPGRPNYNPKLDIIREYQEKLVDKILSYSFEYDNILYCMNNETNEAPDWGAYWINHVRSKAEEMDKHVYVTDMYEEFHSMPKCPKCLQMVANPDFYPFLDVSQINNRVFNEDHWVILEKVINEREIYDLRPANCTKVYGGGNYSWGSGTNEDGVERFCRNLIGGIAAVRHHRPPYGNGLNEKAKATIKAVRKVEGLVSFWDIEAKMKLLGNRENDEAYLACNQGNGYVIYFPGEGNVELDLRGVDKEFILWWINVDTGEWGANFKVEGGGFLEIKTPDTSGWFAVIK
jgi:hypothetical protein